MQRVSCNQNTPRRFGRLGENQLIALITFLSAFVPLSTDIYLPALPGMAKEFSTTPGIANLTLALFFAFYALSALVWGPLSDKLGRRRTLQAGLVVYLLGGIGCMLSASIWHLILARVLQAVGGGCTAAVATAIVKDSFHDRRRREVVMAISMSAAMIAPIAAPVIGAVLLKVMDWRALFGFLVVMGVLGQVGVWLYREEKALVPTTGSVLGSLARLGVVLKNPRFSLLLLTFSLIAIPNIGYVSGSSYIYIEECGLSEQGFSFFFALNALFVMAGPLLYVKISPYIPTRFLAFGTFSVSLICGVVMVVMGPRGPWTFAFTLLPSTMAGSLLRPFATNLMLDQQKGDAGSASSLINSFYLIFGCLGMGIFSLEWSSRVVALGFSLVGVAVLAMSLWYVSLFKMDVLQEPEWSVAQG